VCLAIGLGLRCIFAPPTLVDQVELRVLDWHARVRGRLVPPASVSIVAIDEMSRELVGRWPRPRTRTAEIIQGPVAVGISP
jgi:CHASE2 domain-containing sensor protein